MGAGLAQEPKDYYEMGMRAVNDGHPQEALKIWLRAKGALNVPSTRIAIAFIGLVAQENIDEYEEYATLMYHWGLSATTVSPNKEALDKEIERMSILTTPRIHKHWRRLWNNDDPQLYKALLNFWKQLDPTPTTVNNERLIEHWQRIAYSRAHFTTNKSGAYSADDRAKIYVRYGAPDVKSSGQFQFESSFAKSYIYDIADTPFNCNVSSQQVENKLQQVKNFYGFPKYEVWVYRKDTGRNKKNIFIFGSEAGSGNFEQVISVEDLIPQRAFSMGKIATTGTGLQGSNNPCVSHIRPGLILQIIYYNQLSAVDPFFGDMFDRITERAVSTGGPISLSLAFEMSGLSYSKIENQHLDAPLQWSTEERKMINIPLQIYQYRLLDAQNRPYVATIVQSKPQKAFLLDYLFNYKKTGKGLSRNKLEKDNYFSSYHFIHAVQIYNQKNELPTQVKDSPVIVTQKQRSSISLFTISSIGRGREVFTAKLENLDKKSHYVKGNTLFPQSVRGIGKVVVTQPVPLGNQPAVLQMGDIILGYNYNQQATPATDFPFTVANEHKIPINEELVVHVELYHLQKNSDGIFTGSLSYQLKPKKRFLGWLKKHRAESKLQLNIESSSPRYINNIQVKTKKLKPGTYTMQLVAGDAARGQTVEREFEFEVIK